jgi:AcrR family transcriptional regulator
MNATTRPTPSGHPPGPAGAQLPGPLPGARPGRDPARAIKPGPSRVPPELVAATQRDRLFDALVHTVAEKGYANARVTDICRSAGVTRPAFYALFDGKEDAFLATYRHGTGVLLRVLDSARDRAPDWPAAVRSVLGALLGVLAAVPAFAVMALVEIDAVGPTGRAARRELLRDFHRYFAAAPEPAPPATAESLTDVVVAGVHGVLRDRAADRRAGELPALLDELTYAVLAPFLGPERAAVALAAAREAGWGTGAGHVPGFGAACGLGLS